MKYKVFMTMMAVAAFMVSCNKSNNAAETNDSQASTDTVAVVADSTQIEEAAAVDSNVTAEASREADVKAQDNGLDAEVDQIISMINEHQEAVESLSKEGFPPSSSIAFRTLENLPDYTAKLKKIKSKLTPEQKARIDAAQKKLDKTIAAWG